MRKMVASRERKGEREGEREGERGEGIKNAFEVCKL